jgi:hypothetical protein
MTRHVLIGLVFLLGCATGGAASHLAVPKANAQQARQLSKWEYTCRAPRETDETATALGNRLGAEGWELATVRAGAVTPTLGGGDPDIYCYKRPKL